MSTFTAPAEVEVVEPTSVDDAEYDRPWVVIVWNDPINLMSYVTLVFQKLFGYSLAQATKLMLPGAQRGQGGRLEREPRKIGARRLATARPRALGDHAAGLSCSCRDRSSATVRGGVRFALPRGRGAPVAGASRRAGGQLDHADDPALRRLFPHGTRRSGERGAVPVTRPRPAHRRGVRRLPQPCETHFRKDTLTADEADAWLRALNDLRLVLGTRLDVTEDLDYESLDLNEPHGRDLAVYGYLAWLPELLVEALAEG